MTAALPSPAERNAAAQRGVRRTVLAFDDGHWVHRHLQGDSQAFGVLVDRYQARLLNFVHRTIADRERAEDLVQEAFLRVFRHLHRFDRTKKFSTWIYTIASNLAKNELRGRRRDPLGLGRPVEPEDASARPEVLFRQRDVAEAVSRCVPRLPEALREVFVLREMEGKTYQELCEITGCNLGTVKSRLSRARGTFARLIAPLLD